MRDDKVFIRHILDEVDFIIKESKDLSYDKLIKEGPYRYMRHPHLFCLLIEITGLALIPNSYYLLFFAWMVYFPITLWRIHLEEKALIGKFGEEYLEYRNEVYALIPLRKMDLSRGGSF